MNLTLIRKGLTWLGVLGVGATSWLSVRCSKKADQETDPKKKALAYAPAVAVGIATSACILGIDHIAGIADKEIAALAAGCAYMAKHHGETKQLPGTKPQALEKPLEDTAPWEGPSVEWTGNGGLLCFEAYSGRLFYSSRTAVEEAETRFTERYEGGEYVSLNDFYDELGITNTHFGDQVGWSASEEWYNGPIHFINRETVTEKGEKMLIIDMLSYPVLGWLEV